MRFELVNIHGDLVCEGLPSCLGLTTAYRERVKDVDPEKRAPFPYALYVFDSYGAEVLLLEEGGALEFLVSLLDAADFFRS